MKSWIKGADAFVPIPLAPFRTVDAQRRLSISDYRRAPATVTATLRTPGPLQATIDSLQLTYETSVSFARIATDAYGTSLIENPISTKSLTAGVLCGISDVIAQSRDPSSDEHNIQRTLRFASKGCIGGILWTFWYDWIDGFLTYSTTLTDDDRHARTSLYALAGALLPRSTIDASAPALVFARAHLGAVTTGISMIMEQFFWCPIVYGTFEIPVSTVMNGGEVRSIKKEVDAKLNGLLVSNAKVWTLANLVIYNAPLEWRLFIGNCIDIFWQSIVSDVSADCGKAGDDVCEIPEDGFNNNDVPAPSFSAEKSGI